MIPGVLGSFLKISKVGERERAGAHQGEGQRGRENPKKHGAQVHVPMNSETMTWAETKSWTLNRLSHPGAPWGIKSLMLSLHPEDLIGPETQFIIIIMQIT